MSTVSLEPEPVDLNIKVVLIGEPLIYYLLDAYDPEFISLFKVQADFETDIEAQPGEPGTLCHPHCQTGQRQRAAAPCTARRWPASSNRPPAMPVTGKNYRCGSGSLSTSCRKPTIWPGQKGEQDNNCWHRCGKGHCRQQTAGRQDQGPFIRGHGAQHPLYRDGRSQGWPDKRPLLPHAGPRLLWLQAGSPP